MRDFEQMNRNLASAGIALSEAMARASVRFRAAHAAMSSSFKPSMLDEIAAKAKISAQHIAEPPIHP